MQIQNDIKSMLKESGWSQKELAKQAQVNASALSRYLNKQEDETIAGKCAPFVYGDRRPLPKDTPPDPCSAPVATAQP